MFGWRTRTKEFIWKNEDLTGDRMKMDHEENVLGGV